MQFKLIATAALLTTNIVICPVIAQESPSENKVTPQTQAQPNSDQILAACAQDRADTLPNPFTDVSPNHWAFKAVLSMHYCGAYRGSSPPAKAKRFLEPQPQQQSTTPKDLSFRQKI